MTTQDVVEEEEELANSMENESQDAALIPSQNDGNHTTRGDRGGIERIAQIIARRENDRTGGQWIVRFRYLL